MSRPSNTPRNLGTRTARYSLSFPLPSTAESEDTPDGLCGESGACGSYLSAAQTALGGGAQPGSSSQATALKFAQCMRANGVPDYPDPTANNSQAVHATSGSDLNPANPTFQAASTLCTNKTGYQSKFSTGAPQPGSINVNMAGGFGGKP